MALSSVSSVSTWRRDGDFSLRIAQCTSRRNSLLARFRLSAWSLTAVRWHGRRSVTAAQLWRADHLQIAPVATKTCALPSGVLPAWRALPNKLTVF